VDEARADARRRETSSADPIDFLKIQLGKIDALD